MKKRTWAKKVVPTKKLTEKMLAEKLRIARLEGQTDAYIQKSLATKKWEIIPNDPLLQEEYKKGFQEGYDKAINKKLWEHQREKKETWIKKLFNL